MSLKFLCFCDSSWPIMWVQWNILLESKFNSFFFNTALTSKLSPYWLWLPLLKRKTSFSTRKQRPCHWIHVRVGKIWRSCSQSHRSCHRSYEWTWIADAWHEIPLDDTKYLGFVHGHVDSVPILRWNGTVESRTRGCDGLARFGCCRCRHYRDWQQRPNGRRCRHDPRWLWHHWRQRHRPQLPLSIRCSTGN